MVLNRRPSKRHDVFKPRIKVVPLMNAAQPLQKNRDLGLLMANIASNYRKLTHKPPNSHGLS